MKITHKKEEVTTVDLNSLPSGTVFRFPDNTTLYVKGSVSESPNVTINSDRAITLRLSDGNVTAPSIWCRVIPVSAELLVDNT
ncbi:hypothetical protein NJ01_112 [Escherichia phage NJ01]|uniref:Uncharacterized protein n=1 Tax=Escherichia phage NJ01 TaxID=1237159 RepID=K4I194_9CAUD|nr:hypothetical protein NJ01_112 [Escherichia phage NJ01]AFU62532.1 hypothetical protein NJ01_112 [Escherichia phage NJ01]